MNDSLHNSEEYNELSELLHGIRNEEVDATATTKFPITREFSFGRGRYNAVSPLTHGGMKKIELVEDNLTKLTVAKATLYNKGSEEDVEMFFREARITAGLQHPNIIPVFDIGFDSRHEPFFTMKLLTGDTLQAVIKKIRFGDVNYLQRYPINVRLNIFLKICDAISYSHSCGIVHLDLKPDNIRLGEFGEVYVCDWGLAKVIDDGAVEQIFDSGIYNVGTLSGNIKGTPGFMAPEQIRKDFGSKSEATDIFSLGALLFAILNLKDPFRGDTIKLTLLHTLKGKMTSWSKSKKVPYSLKAVCLKAMDIDPAQRYKSVNELASEISAYLNGFATTAQEAGFFAQLRLLISRNRRISCSILVSLLIIVTMWGVFIKKTKDNEQKALDAQERAEKALILYKKQQESARLAYKMYDAERGKSQANLKALRNIQANVDQLIKLCQKQLSKRDIKGAEKICETIFRNSPDHERGIELRATLLIIQGDFEEAVRLLAKQTSNELTSLHKICMNQLELKEKAVHKDERLLILLNELDKVSSLRQVLKYVIKNIPRISYRDSYLPVIKKALEITNPKQENLHFELKRRKRKNYIDLSNNSELKDISVIDQLFAKSINLSNTKVTDISPLANKRQLNYLDISGSAFKNESQIVLLLPNLKELVLSKGQFTEKQIDKLPRGLKVIYR